MPGELHKRRQMLKVKTFARNGACLCDSSDHGHVAAPCPAQLVVDMLSCDMLDTGVTDGALPERVTSSGGGAPGMAAEAASPPSTMTPTAPEVRAESTTAATKRSFMCMMNPVRSHVVERRCAGRRASRAIGANRCQEAQTA